MHKLKLYSLVFLATSLLSGAVFAQDMTSQTFCGDLAQDDCTLLQDARSAMADIESARFITQIYATVAGSSTMRSEGMADEPMMETTAEATTDVTMEMTAEATTDVMVEATEAPTGMSQETTTVGAGASEPYTAIAITADGYFTTGGATLGTTGAPIDDISLWADVSVLMPVERADAADSIGQVAAFEVVVVDGNAYIHVRQMRTREGELADTGIPAGWYGVDLGDLFDELSNAQAGMRGNMFVTGMDTGFNMQRRFDDAAFQDYVYVTRLNVDDMEPEQAEVFGDVAAFVTVFDLAGFWSDPANQTLVREQLGFLAADDAFDGHSRVIADASVRYVDFINLDDNQIHRQEIVIENLLVETEDGEQRRVDLSIVTEYSDFGMAEMVAAPDDAQLIPANLILRQLALASDRPLGISGEHGALGVSTDTADVEATAEAVDPMSATATPDETMAATETPDAVMTDEPDADDEEASDIDLQLEATPMLDADLGDVMGATPTPSA